MKKEKNKNKYLWILLIKINRLKSKKISNSQLKEANQRNKNDANLKKFKKTYLPSKNYNF